MIIPSQQKISRGKVPLSLAGPAYSDYSSNVNAQTCIGWYLASGGPGGKGQRVLHPMAGTTLVRSVGSGPHRGELEHKGKLYIVSGAEVIEMDENENFTTVGTISTNSGKVSMASSGEFGDELLIVDGVDGYVWDGSTVTVIADGDFPNTATTVRYMDGRFIISILDRGDWWISDLNSATGWTATQFANAERDPDNLVAVEVNNRDLMLLGEWTTEVGANTGATPFPFEAYANGLFDKGCAARFSVAKADDYMFWLSQDRRGAKQILRARGISYDVVSSPALEAAISTYSSVSDAEAFTYSERGIIFYQISFPSALTTWVFNTSIENPMEAWTQRKTGTTRHIASTYCYFNKKHYVGAHDSSNLYTLDSDVYLDDETSIIRERTSAVIALDNKARIRHYGVELEFEAGTGLISGQGSNPQASLDWSDDGGHVWSNARQESVGEIGQYGRRVLFKHLGMSRNRIYRIRVSDPVKWVLIEGYADIEEMLH